MLYQAYDSQTALLAPVRFGAGLARMAIDRLPPACRDNPLVRHQAAWCELAMRSTLIHQRPEFGIDHVEVGGKGVGVREEPVVTTPFGRLVHFAKDNGRDEPRVLIVAALAGHFSTLMRDTVRTMLADHDVYLAEWSNARDIPVEAGPFGLDEYIDHVVTFIEELGPGTHVVAVCQPCPAVVAATSLMAGRGSSSTPRSLTLMAGPVDTSCSPTVVNKMAGAAPLSWFEHNFITSVPIGYEGFGRRVYPGFLQVTAFVSMNFGRHVSQHVALYDSLVDGDLDTADSIRTFYDEYFAVLDVTAEFYLDTVDRVFKRNLLATGEFEWRGQLVDPGTVTQTALLTVEGERDDVCGPGQTVAAHELFTGIEPSNKRHHLQVGVGHYGVFSGHRWQTEIYPVVRDFILLYA